MKKTMIATLAALMLAGALSAVSDATSTGLSATAMFIADGSAPVPFAAAATDTNSDSISPASKF